jgi:hypothetical protein
LMRRALPKVASVLSSSRMHWRYFAAHDAKGKNRFGLELAACKRKAERTERSWVKPRNRSDDDISRRKAAAHAALCGCSLVTSARFAKRNG